MPSMSGAGSRVAPISTRSRCEGTADSGEQRKHARPPIAVAAGRAGKIGISHHGETQVHILGLCLKIAAPVFVVAGALHLVYGVGADVLLGAQLPAETLADPTLNSQNRFYGVAFTLYGILFYLCANDLAKYATVLRCVLWVFFAAGLARLVSIATHGVPPPLVLVLLATELALPPLLHLWLSRALRDR